MDQSIALQLLVVPVAAVAVAAVSRRRGWPAPLLLVLAGLVLSPFVPEYALDPEIVLLVFLPPLLYSAAIDSSYLGLKAVRRPVALLSVGLVLFSTLVIGWVVHLLLPDLPPAAAFALGAIVAPPDAVAAVAVARRLGLPRKVITILVGESLFNDATALTAYRVAVAAALGQGITWLGAVGQFAYAAAGGAAIGLVLAWLLSKILRALGDALVENTVMLLTPFGVYLAAELAHTSGVVAVVVVGLYIGHRLPRSGFGTRLLSGAVWKVMDFFLESVVFALIGLQMWPIVTALDWSEPLEPVGTALAVFAAAVLVRGVWVVPATYLPRLLFPGVRRREPEAPSWQHITIVGWAGMRGVVSLAAAFAVPEDFPGRATLLFLTFTVVIGTLLLQGLSFPALIRRLRVSNEQEAFADDLAEAGAQQAAAAAALARLDELVADGVADVHREVVEQLRLRAERRTLSAWERLGGGTGPGGEDTPGTVYRRLRREMLAAEREVFVRLRDERRIDDEVLRRVMHELDFEEATLERD
ncbi:Na+/H+ antiporter [Planomonospora parontospora subsp. parontospora]|uniref:Na+/H+ antiporter n=2 Tax=Planomonospora parontospora TaxID=58119 RepID=A0AA37F5U2_9ACTN|nr:Na+/H+ antiporter [Planomonospora parontospora]GGK79179.1 Na+/H+ antiporter [Planomonospora parontospora]GII10233.1 Na+/H+ antiporter [Planomonospora parontospora subsp. parontospora]